MTSFTAILMAAAVQVNVPADVFSAMCWVESAHRPHVVNYDDGGEDSLGLCQIKYSTARYMGFKGTREQLMRPKTNAKYAARYLAYQIKRYKGDITKGVVAYNAGRYIQNHRYANKVFRAAKLRYGYAGP